MIQNEAHQSARKHGLQGEQRLDDALHAAGGDHPPRPGGNIKRSPLELLCTWILEVRSQRCHCQENCHRKLA